MHPGDLAGGFSDLEMTLLLYCAGAATENLNILVHFVPPQYYSTDDRPGRGQR